MRTTRARALAIRDRYAIEGVASDDDLLRIVAGEGLEIDPDQPFRGRVRAVYLYRFKSFAMARGMERAERRLTIGHELGHHLLHPEPASLRTSGGDLFRYTRYELEADLFAGFLALGADYGATEAETWQELAEAAALPGEFVRRWVSVARDVA